MIRKILVFIILSAIPVYTYAHPIDISNSTISLNKETINISTYFHSFEIDYLLKENWISIDSIEQYYENKKIIADYINKNINIFSNQKECKLKSVNINEDEIYDILTNWLKVEYSIKCSEKIKDLDLEINYFNNFPLQTNKISIYNLNKSKDLLVYKVLTPKINSIKIDDIDNYNEENKIDSDCDWISDEDEKIYNTDSNKIDTDNDNYTDWEEIKWWWNPTDTNLWPWQEYKNKIIEVKCNNKEDEIIITSTKNTDSYNENNQLFANDFLNKTLKYITLFFTDNSWNIFYIFLLVYILWIIHAIWPWHSKSLLIAYTLQNDTWYKKWIIYSIIFSVTHILDILLLFLLTTLLFHFIDISKYTYYIQIFSVSVLFIFSIYLVIKAFRKKKELELKNEKSTLMIAFLSWLAPCSFAWSIYFLLLSIWKISMILPLIISLWLWILSTLIFIVILTVYMKNKAIERTKFLSLYANKISAIIIFIISISLWITLINT